MINTTVLTHRFDRALVYATHVHGGQTRKGTSIPYVAHVLAVAATVLEYGGSEDMAIAALLHDAVEDQGGEPRLADVRNRFGTRVADIVRSCSDSTAVGQPKEDWLTRRRNYLDHIKTADHETLLVSLSDKIHNARSILRDLRREDVGEMIWDRFKGSREETLGYYEELSEIFLELFKSKGQPGQRQLAKELAEIVKVLREE